MDGLWRIGVLWLGLACTVTSQDVPRDVQSRYGPEVLQMIANFRRGWTQDDDNQQEESPLPSFWTPWTACSNICGGGQRVRRRSNCSGSRCVEVRSCNTNRCAERPAASPDRPDFAFRPSSWLEWSTCTASCGSGLQARTRLRCSNACVQTRPCNTPACPPRARSGSPRNRGFQPTQNQQRWWDTVISSVARKRRKRNHAFWDSVVIRREYRMLSDSDRNNLHGAIFAAKTTMIDNLSQYDIMVSFHRRANSPSAHQGPAFLPWHREFLFRFEIIIQRHCPRCTLPYWDSRLDSLLPNPKHSVMWTPRFLGNPEGPVTSGPFVNWSPISTCRRLGQVLSRGSDAVQPEALFRDSDVNEVYAKRSFTDLTVPTSFEWKHGGPHVYVGGHMRDIECSPTDPTFWLLHSFIDCIWMNFRQTYQTSVLTTDYPANGGTGGAAHLSTANMRPFQGLWNINGLSTFYRDFYYTCEAFVVNCNSDANCRSRYLWCHNGRCKSKIRFNGNCSGLPRTTSPCVQGRCNGVTCS